jgi:hypothetical protein
MKREGCYRVRNTTLLDPILRQKGTGFRTNILREFLIFECETHVLLYLITMINI